MLRKTLIASALSLAFAAAHAAAPLQLKVYNAGESSFDVNAVLVSGSTEAVLIDSGFSRADAYRIAANVLDSGKTLKTILISNADPDYYFGAEVLKGIFPQAQLVATAAVVDRIRATLPAKMAFWPARMGLNAPSRPLVPDVLQGDRVTVDGESIEVRGNRGVLADRPYVWIPALRAIAGNVGVYGQLHVWTADTQTAAARKAWLAQLEEMRALRPAVVVPGHMKAGSKLDVGNIDYTRDYLLRFEAEAASARDSAALITAMQHAYPDAGMALALDIGAKVNKGDMKW